MNKKRKKEIRWCSSPTILDWIGIWKRGKTHHYKTENQQQTQLNSGIISRRVLTCESSNHLPSPPLPKRIKLNNLLHIQQNVYIFDIRGSGYSGLFHRLFRKIMMIAIVTTIVIKMYITACNDRITNNWKLPNIRLMTSSGGSQVEERQTGLSRSEYWRTFPLPCTSTTTIICVYGIIQTINW